MTNVRRWIEHYFEDLILLRMARISVQFLALGLFLLESMYTDYTGAIYSLLTENEPNAKGNMALMTVMILDIAALGFLELKIEKDNSLVFPPNNNLENNHQGPYTIVTLRFLTFLLSGNCLAIGITSSMTLISLFRISYNCHMVSIKIHLV